MKFKLLIFGLTISILNFSCNTQTVSLYVGTYTNGNSEGIYRFDFNTKTGTLKNKTLVAETKNPSFISFSPDKKFMYAVGEGEMSISSFQVNKNGKLSFINSVSSNGGAPCHISINEMGDKVIVSNYSGGNISIYNINSNGSLNKASQVFDHNTKNEKAHAHSAQFYRNDLFVSDLGRNAVYHYKLKGSHYELKSEAIINMDSNSGPRHFTLTQDGQFIYIINEYANTVTVGKRTNEGFEMLENISTLDDDFKGESYCADIHLSEDERFLYGSNRGENSIVVFKRNTVTGKLDKIQNISVHGDWPRNFTLDPTGKFLLVANQKSNNISVFKINPDTGKLSFLHNAEAPIPVCLLF